MKLKTKKAVTAQIFVIFDKCFVRSVIKIVNTARKPVDVKPELSVLYNIPDSTVFFCDIVKKPVRKIFIFDIKRKPYTARFINKPVFSEIL